jgi:GT2 family glycosyltransferase
MSDSTLQDAPQALRVSVILLASNQAPALRRALAALEQIEHRHAVEVLVVDCASQDGSRELDAEFPAAQILRLPHHLGAGRALNIAVRTAKAELVLFLSPNVEVAPETVWALADALADDADCAAVCPALEGRSNVLHMPDPAAPKLTAAAPDRQGPVVIECATLDALLVRKSFIVAMHFFDKRYGHAWVDAELAMQIRRAGKKIRYVPQIRAVYHAAPDPLEGNSLAITDWVTGAAEFAGKYGGGAFGIRLGAAMAALGRFDFGGFVGSLSGQKLDGGQAG